jgi:hypothetical protein
MFVRSSSVSRMKVRFAATCSRVVEGLKRGPLMYNISRYRHGSCTGNGWLRKRSAMKCRWEREVPSRS